MAHRLISWFLVVALLFQALAVMPVAWASGPSGQAASLTHHCAGDRETARHACTCCPDGVSSGACVSACGAPAVPVDVAPSIISVEPVALVFRVATVVHGPDYAPLDPPPIR